MDEPEDAPPDAGPAEPSDTPIPDVIWDGLLAWMRGTFAVIGTALAISATLGWPRRPAATVTGGQLGVLAVQALVCSGVIVRSGRHLSRRPAGAVAVAFAAGVPAALALLMVMAWRDPREPVATWGALFLGSLRFAALEALPVGYLLWNLARRPLAWRSASGAPEAG
jgi:hypothetical protein